MTSPMRSLLDRTAFYVTDLEDQGESTYILFLPELGVLPSKAIAVDTHKVADVGVHFYRENTLVATLHHKTEWMLLSRSVIQTLSREALYRMERGGEQAFTALMQELYPEECSVADAKIAMVKKQLGMPEAATHEKPLEVGVYL